MRIYTKTGDGGETGLPGGRRVAKDDPRVVALGEIDELGAALGLVRSLAVEGKVLGSALASLQRDLLALGALLAGTEPGGAGPDSQRLAWGAERVGRLERLIDEHESALPELRAFILPGGSPPGAALHLARAVCRRAERAVVVLAKSETLEPTALAYLNRLSDLLFVLAREVNARAGVSDEPW